MKRHYKSNLEALANLYVKGYDLDWELLHADEAKRKIALPDLAHLQKERYWVPDITTLQPLSSLTSTVPSPTIKGIYYYHPIWQEQALKRDEKSKGLKRKNINL